MFHVILKKQQKKKTTLLVKAFLFKGQGKAIRRMPFMILWPLMYPVTKVYNWETDYNITCSFYMETWTVLFNLRKWKGEKRNDKDRCYRFWLNGSKICVWWYISQNIWLKTTKIKITVQRINKIMYYIHTIYTEVWKSLFLKQMKIFYFKFFK